VVDIDIMVLTARKRQRPPFLRVMARRWATLQSRVLRPNHRGSPCLLTWWVTVAASQPIRWLAARSSTVPSNSSEWSGWATR
jgi:hypothetical protein